MSNKRTNQNSSHSEHDKDESTNSDKEPSLTESYVGDHMQSIDDLVGERDITPKDGLALLRLEAQRLNAEILKELKIYKTSGAGALVLGPFKLTELEKWSSKGLLRSNDLIQTPFSRWLPASEFFDNFPKSEMTATIEVTSSFTQSGSRTVEMTKTTEMQDDGEGSVIKGLELEDFIPQAKTQSEVSNASAEADLGVRRTSETKTIVMPLAKSSVIKVDSLSDNQAPKKAGKLVSKQIFLAVTFGVLLLSVFLFLEKSSLLDGSKEGFEAKTSQGYLSTVEVKQSETLVSNDWPDFLKPLPTESLVNVDDALMAKLEPILAQTRFSNYDLSQSQVQLIKRIASPASASWSARRLASNVLSVWMYVSGGASAEESIKVLTPIYEASPDDFVTVTNLSIFTLESGNTADAEDLAQVALRLCSSSSCWFSHLLMAYIKASAGQGPKSETHFQEAAVEYAESVAVFGTWAVNLSRQDGARQTAKSRALAERAIWGDPDRFFMSPMQDAVGSLILFRRLLSEAKEDLISPLWGLSVGQQKYLKWRFDLLAGRQSNQSIDALAKELSSESQPLSQLLSSYLMAHIGKLDESREKLTSVLGLIKEDMPVQGWPWTFAGDLQTERGYLDQALVFYQRALGRDAKDRAAIYGLGQLMRKKSDFQGARQKFAEAAAMDSQFVLPKLRISRFDWHGRLGHKRTP